MNDEIIERLTQIETDLRKLRLESTEKATLEFDMTDPQARDDHWIAINGHLAFIAINEIVEKFRALDKYDNDYVVDGKIHIDVVRELINEIITDRNIWRDGIL